MTPIEIRLLSMLAKFISIKNGISLKKCYFIVSLLSALFVSINISRGDFTKAYNFKSNNRWYFQYLLIGYTFIYNKIIYPLDVYL